VGLDGTGDRTMGGTGGGGMTVQSVVNTLRNFNVEVPANLVRTRNVAVVLVTAEVSPYLRPGGRFDLQVASMGDARSLRGGVLYMTPLIAEAGGRPLGLAQGALVLSEGVDGRDRFAPPTVETSGRIPQGGQLEADLPRPTLAQSNRLLLREPDIATASRIAAAINGALGASTATSRTRARWPSPSPPPTAPWPSRASATSPCAPSASRASSSTRATAPWWPAATSSCTRPRSATARSRSPSAATPRRARPVARRPTCQGAVRVAVGTPVQRVAAALHAVQTPPADMAAIFAALREVGALQAEVVIR
jgi:flagellar P-ring protein precursor FlgI